MNPKIAITIDTKNRAVATVTGMATVGAKVDVEVVGLPGEVQDWKPEDPYNGKSVRFRVVTDAGQDVVRFPMVEKTGPSDGDKWTVVPAVGTTTPETYKTNDGTNTTPVVDFDTDVLRKAFRGVPYNETLEFGLILDSSVDAAQYAVGKIKIRQWATDCKLNPTVLPDWKGTVKSIVGTTLKDETMKNFPTQNEMTVALKTIWERLGGTVATCLLAMCAFGEVTREMEWQDVPPRTKIGTVVDLSESGGGGGVTPRAVTNIVTNVVTKAYVEGLGISGGGTFTRDIRATANIGVHKVGPSGYVDLALSNKTLQAGMEYLVQSNRNPTVTRPSVKSMKLTNSSGADQNVLAREVGTTFTPKYGIEVDTGTYEFGPNPTGVAFNEFKVYTVSNGVERLMSITNQTATLSGCAFTVLDDTAFYVKAQGHHTVGAVPSNNIGQAVPALQIPAGWYKSGSAPVATTNDATFVPSSPVTGYRNWYGVITNSLDGTVDSSYIRGRAANNWGNALNSGTKRILIPAKTKRILVAMPNEGKYTRTIDKITAETAFNETPVTENFTEGTKQVFDASGVNALSYKTWTYDVEGPTGTDEPIYYNFYTKDGGPHAPLMMLLPRSTSSSSEPEKEYKPSSTLPISLYREYYSPLDVSDVFYSEADLNYYCTTGGVTTGVSTYWRNKTPYPYAGQIVTLATDAAHPTNYVLKAKADGTYDKELIGAGGGTSLDEGVLTNKTIASFGPSAANSIVGNLRNTAVTLNVSNGVFSVRDNGTPIWESTGGGIATNDVQGIIAQNVATNYLASKAYVDEHGAKYSFARPGDWCVGYTIGTSNTFASVGHYSADDEYFRSNCTTRCVSLFARSGKAYPQMLNIYEPMKISVTNWVGLTDGISIGDDGSFSVVSDGLYRVSAAASDEVRERDIITQVALSHEFDKNIYAADYAGTVRKSVNDEAYSILTNATTVVKTNGDIHVYNTFIPRFVPNVPGTGNAKPFAVSKHVLASAWHHDKKPVGAKLYFTDDDGTTEYVTTKEWVNLREWAATNGCDVSLVSTDLALIRCEKETAVPDGCIPYFAKEATIQSWFGESQKGIVGFFCSQHHKEAIPIVFKGHYGFERGFAGLVKSDVPEKDSSIYEGLIRSDINDRLCDMGPQQNVNSGDCGRPCFFMKDGNPVILIDAGNGYSCVFAFEAIQKFVEAYGDTIKEEE